jgi:hypothetical protein
LHALNLNFQTTKVIFAYSVAERHILAFYETVNIDEFVKSILISAGWTRKKVPYTPAKKQRDKKAQ